MLFSFFASQTFIIILILHQRHAATIAHRIKRVISQLYTAAYKTRKLFPPLVHIAALETTKLVQSASSEAQWCIFHYNMRAVQPTPVVSQEILKIPSHAI